MPIITIKTIINAPAQRCFDLSRSIDLHQISTIETKERAIAGKTSGLIGLNETVTWQAKHFGITQKLTSKITAFDSPSYFVDEMVSGAFKAFRHEHFFEMIHDQTEMTDRFDYTSPLGIIGKLFDNIVLEKYMFSLLYKRNQVIKEFAESNKWKKVLSV
ncbi:ligand-binding SRPBCC domain-containing protein [Roseivirga ehrenbergii]|uniref:Cell division protein n=1 Tax=Roseivirga ehrenbergii (strain DSM 102268 / JCM 13514 / KCTC 12282 / NCIMB 14502 / KMM 6017) TaxID=279360 RepID=A0A150X0L3_ROSEK|nr:SRPBCC family protein [Roseivirga ehrenbergii]KYG72226.1 cell division protein [Roseivirga ehrenbergii]TCL13465.1 ligand-binding SRPBCC domain-containing protein [Roseivirga ehrenbergii]